MENYMQIGYGNSGVIVGEYGISRPNADHPKGTQDESQSQKDTNPVIGWIEPNCENSKWIMWFMENGDAVVYTDRYDDGAVIGDPIRLKAR